MEIIILDGKKMNSFDGTHDYLAKSLRLPQYYGRNLDALYDCLGESFSDDAIIILMNGGEMKSALGAYGDKLCRVLEDAMGECGYTFIYRE